MLKIFCLFLILTINIFFTLNITAQTNSEKDLKFIQGIVTNPSGYPLSDLRIIFESNEMYQEIKTDKNGMYELKMPEGIYEVRTDEWLGKLPYSEIESSALFYKDCPVYFRPFQRAPFKLSQDSILNLTLLESGCFRDISKDEKIRVFPNNEIKKVRYTRIPFNLSYFSIGIQYQYAKGEKDKTIYENDMFLSFSSDLITYRAKLKEAKNPRRRVLVTYDLKNINADKVEFDRKENLLMLLDNVILEENGTTGSFKKIIIRIQENPVFTFVK